MEWFGAHTYFWQRVVVQLKSEELAKVVVNRHLNPEDCSGMTWAESAGGRQKDFVLLKWKSDTSWKAGRKTETNVN